MRHFYPTYRSSIANTKRGPLLNYDSQSRRSHCQQSSIFIEFPGRRSSLL